MATNSNIATTSTGSFAYPPLYNFPPFFTLQRNAQTLASQLTTWTRFVLDFCQHNRIFTLDVEGAWERTTGAGGLFRNAAIQRELNSDSIRQVFKALVDQGSATWDPPIAKSNSKSANKSLVVADRILVFWRKPEEWGEQIFNWISKTGQNGSIMTFFELTEGDLVQDQEFHYLPIPLLRLALLTLEKQGKARVFEGTEGGDSTTGVKFA
ncbi:ESCRT-II complex, vps25 subunit [Meira miltonrushii]|uniref:ESCRT-II complex subunit VPS25 n=1 Tax=Meira miltonrushii TaxID=1280837 RepID=A0A316V8W5_9BASI|nr:ESCRT-II complex, vps25 subunit [Meira miltonrushii]PWN33478.1 ESCRT-II complex, vps25 subunit [Meira miltonrushii]